MTVAEHKGHHLRTMAYLIEHADELGIAGDTLGFEVRENPGGEDVPWIVELGGGLPATYPVTPSP